MKAKKIELSLTKRQLETIQDSLKKMGESIFNESKDERKANELISLLKDIHEQELRQSIFSK